MISVLSGSKTNTECYFNGSCLEIFVGKETGTESELLLPGRPSQLGPPTQPGYNPIISPSPGLRDLNVNHKTCHHENIQNLFLSEFVNLFPVLRATESCQILQRNQ